MPKKVNNNRVYPDGTRPRPDLSEAKRAEAKERQKDYDSLTIEQKLSMLDTKFGVGQGAKKQRARLASILEKKNAPASPTDTKPVETEKKHMKAKERRHKEQKD